MFQIEKRVDPEKKLKKKSVLKNQTGYTNEELKHTHLMYVPVPDSDVLQTLRGRIKEEDYFSSELNLERQPHVTICLKIKCLTADKMNQIQKETKSFRFEIDDLTVMQSKNEEGQLRDVLCLSARGKDLEQLHIRACGIFETYNPWPTYEPHVTLAFLKGGRGEKYLKQSEKSIKMEVEANMLVWSLFKEKTDEHTRKLE